MVSGDHGMDEINESVNGNSVAQQLLSIEEAGGKSTD